VAIPYQHCRKTYRPQLQGSTNIYIYRERERKHGMTDINSAPPPSLSLFPPLCPSFNFFKEARCFGNRICFSFHGKNYLTWCSPQTELFSITAHHTHGNLLRYAPENKPSPRVTRKCQSKN
jgi:hypothetical protein